MNSKQLAEFYGISTQAVNRWSLDKTNRKTIQAEADVTPLEWQLVGEIAQLCYLYNAKGWYCDKPVNTTLMSIGALHVCVTFFEKTEPVRTEDAKVSNTAEMQLIKMQLEKLVYGEEK